MKTPENKGENDSDGTDQLPSDIEVSRPFDGYTFVVGDEFFKMLAMVAKELEARGSGALARELRKHLE